MRRGEGWIFTPTLFFRFASRYWSWDRERVRLFCLRLAARKTPAPSCRCGIRWRAGLRRKGSPSKDVQPAIGSDLNPRDSMDRKEKSLTLSRIPPNASIRASARLRDWRSLAAGIFGARAPPELSRSGRETLAARPRAIPAPSERGPPSEIGSSLGFGLRADAQRSGHKP